MKLPSNLLQDKVALITGCNSGIGKAIVEIFAQNGASILACARKESEDFIQFINFINTKYNCTIAPLYFDLTNEIELKNRVKQLVSNKKRIDVLVNNAGIAHGGLFHMTSISKIKEVFEINFFSQLLLTQFVSRIMVKHRKGSIINITSIAGIDGLPGYSAYGTSKAAFNYATKTIAKELAEHGVRVNAIAPGLTETKMADLMEYSAKESMINSSAMQRLGKPIEIANTALFLASDLSSFITGQVIRVDGGVC
jgi:3-oxoacyl-[acyl-carrier protein] reductase